MEILVPTRMVMLVDGQLALKTLTPSFVRVLRCARPGLYCHHAGHPLPPRDSGLFEASSKLDA